MAGALGGAFLLALLVHAAAMVGSGTLSGIVVRRVRFGVGPTVVRVGRLELAPLPLGCAVQFKDGRAELMDDGDEQGDFERSPAMVRLLISLSGCLALLGMALLTLGPSGFAVFLSGFKDFVVLALTPFSDGQAVLTEGFGLARHSDFSQIVGLIAAKLAALNLLPFMGSNGSAALAVVLRRLVPEREPSASLMNLWGLTSVLLALCWLAALGYFFFQLP